MLLLTIRLSEMPKPKLVFLLVENSALERKDWESV